MTSPENTTPEGQEALKRIDAVLEALTSFRESQLAFNEMVMERFDQTDERLTKIDERFDQTDERLTRIDERFDQTDERLTRIDERFDQTDERLTRIDERFDQTDERLTKIDERFDQTDERLTKIDERFDQTDERLTKIDERFDQTDERLTKIDERFDQTDERLTKIDERFDQTDERLTKIDERFDQTDERLTKIDDRLERSDERFDKMEQHLGYLRGAHAVNVARRNASLIADDMGYQIIMVLPREELIGFAKMARDKGKPNDDVRSFREADLVMLVRDDNGQPAYIAVEASFTLANTDIRRAKRNADYLTEFTGLPSRGAVAGVDIARGRERNADAGGIYCYRIPVRDLESD